MSESDVGADRPIAEGPVELVCRWLCRLCLVAMIAAIAAELVLRGFFNHSLEFVDEVGAYLLVALTFISLGVSQASDSFHRVEFFLRRLDRRARLRWFTGFNLLSLLFAAVLDAYLFRVVLQSHEQQSQAMSILMTPLWIPQLAMPLGLTAFCFTLLRIVLRDLRTLRSGS